MLKAQNHSFEIIPCLHILIQIPQKQLIVLNKEITFSLHFKLSFKHKVRAMK